MEVLAEDGVKVTIVDSEEFQNDIEIKRAIKHLSESKTPYIEVMIDKKETYSTVTVTIPNEWEKNCIFSFEELYEKLKMNGLELRRYVSSGNKVKGIAYKEATFFLPYPFEKRVGIAKEVAKLAYECTREPEKEIAGEIVKVDDVQYVKLKDSHEFWCNDYKGGEKIENYCKKYKWPYIQLGLKFPYSKSERVRIDIYFLKEWVEKYPNIPPKTKNRIIDFVYSEPIETDLIAHSAPGWFDDVYGYKIEWWGIITPKFAVIPAVTTNKKRAFYTAETISLIVRDCLNEDGIIF